MIRIRRGSSPTISGASSSRISAASSQGEGGNAPEIGVAFAGDAFVGADGDMTIAVAVEHLQRIADWTGLGLG